MSSPRYDGLRVRIVGGCQIRGLREGAEASLPGADVRAWHLRARPEWTAERLAEEIADADLLITQLDDAADHGPLALSHLRARHAKIVFLPFFIFHGFQPDIIDFRIRSAPERRLQGPLGVHHSRLVVACHHLRVPVEHVPRLFNAVTFEALGYFAAFALSKSVAIKIFSGYDFDIAGSFDIWLQDGCFTYVLEHPHVRVLVTLARQAIAKAGFEPAPIDPAFVPRDHLAESAQLPVYPAIARRIGCAGSLDFLRAEHVVPQGDRRAMSLDAFVRGSYAALDRIAPGDLIFNSEAEQAIETIRALYSH